MFEDGDEKYFESDFSQVVIDKEINENEWQTLKEGDVMLTKVRNSTAMAKGASVLFLTLMV